jgi:hypothetical protein
MNNRKCLYKFLKNFSKETCVACFMFGLIELIIASGNIVHLPCYLGTSFRFSIFILRAVMLPPSLQTSARVLAG